MIEGRDNDLSHDQWQEIARKLQAPFAREDVEFRVQGRVSDQSGRAQVVAYVDARVVQDRLDDVVGPGNWSFDWEPVLVENGQVMLAKGTLTVFGVSKSDIGSASNFEQSLGCVSHAFKRAAVHWGVGRYLYGLPMNWVNVEKGGRLSDAVMAGLRNSLPKSTETAPSEDEAARKREPRKIAPAAPTTAASAAPRRQSVIREAPLQEPVAEAPERAASEARGETRGEARGDEPAATEQQLVSIRKLCEALKRPEPDGVVSYEQARRLITQLSADYQRMRRAS